MMNLFFGSSAELDIVLDGQEDRQKGSIRLDNGLVESLPVYYDGDTVSGNVNIKLKQGKMEHYGIRVELFGLIEQFADRTNRFEFLSMARELARPGSVAHDCSYPFEFGNVEKPYESYSGVNVKLRYFLRVTVVKRLSDLVKEQDLLVHSLATYPDSIAGIKMEVGIENCLHIEFEFNKSKYHLKDAIVGKIFFLLVRVKVKHMEIQVLRRELVGLGPGGLSDCETVASFEIMDGAPVRGETIPVRIFLSGYNLGPTMRDINKRFSVRYFLNLVLVDEEDRRYFKQQEVTLFRRPANRQSFDRGLFHHHQRAARAPSQVSAVSSASNLATAASADEGLSGCDAEEARDVSSQGDAVYSGDESS